MKYSRNTVGGMQLDEYVVEIAEIYSANDRNRSLWDVWCHALHHAAAIAERLRKKSPPPEFSKRLRTSHCGCSLPSISLQGDSVSLRSETRHLRRRSFAFRAAALTSSGIDIPKSVPCAMCVGPKAVAIVGNFRSCLGPAIVP